MGRDGACLSLEEDRARPNGRGAPRDDDTPSEWGEDECIPGLEAESSDDEGVEPRGSPGGQEEPPSSEDEVDTIITEMNLRALAWNYGARTTPLQSGGQRGDGVRRQFPIKGECAKGRCTWTCNGHQRWQKQRCHAPGDRVAMEETLQPVEDMAAERARDSAADTLQMGHRRIGEAKNPGPDLVPGSTHGDIPWSGPRPQDALRYPPPHRPGFRDVLTPGFEEGEAGAEVQGQGNALRIETVNATGWGTLRSRLKSTEAHAILAQETKVDAARKAAVSDWSSRNGWKMIDAPAVKGPNGGASAGVAVFIRNYLGAHRPTTASHIIEPGRAVAAVLDIEKCRPTLLISIYLHDGEGLTERNKAILAKVGAFLQSSGKQWQYVIGGDFNLVPEVLATSMFAQGLSARIVAPANKRGTCRTVHGSRTYDYFVVSEALSQGMEDVATVEVTGVKTHTPVEITFRARLTALRKLTLQKPRAMNKERVFGPLLPAPNWSEAMAVIEDAVRKAKKGSREAASQALAEAYEHFATVAERELIHITGSEYVDLGQRAKGPKLQWKSVLPEKRPDTTPTAAAALAWLEGAVREIEALASHRTEDRRDDGAAMGEDACGGDELGAEPDDLLDEVQMGLIADYPSEVVDAQTLGLHNEVMDMVDRAREARRLPEEDKQPFIDAVRQLKARIHQALQQTEREVEAKAKKDWHAWICDGLGEGAKNAHAASRVPSEWTPTTTAAADGTTIMSNPCALLEAQRDKYIGKWSPTEQPRSIHWETREALPRAGADLVESASAAFRWGTAATYDGIHPRHLSLLCKEGRQAVAAIWEAMELLGDLPRQLKLVTMPLLAKPQGGYRAIGMMAALYRVWAKARRIEATAWEQAHARSYWSADRGNAPIDTVWRQEARQEAKVSMGEQAAAIIYDMESFFETIDRTLLLRRARQVGFPEPIVRLCLAAYAGPRMLVLDGALSREVHPTCGIVAGCGMATTMVRIYCITEFDMMLTRLPKTTHFDAHIDDLVITGEALPVQLVRDMTNAERELAGVIEKGLKGKVAEGKAGVVATSLDVAKQIKRNIPLLTGPITRAMPNLGTDCMAGRAKGRQSRKFKQFVRIKRGQARSPRLRLLSKVIGNRARTIFVTGVCPAMQYGAATRGMSDMDVRKLRRVAASSFPPHARNRSLALALLLNGNPTARAEVAPASQMARMVWKAKTQPADACRRGSGLTDIRSWVECVKPELDQLTGDIAQRSMGGQPMGSRQANAAWRSIKGPMAATALTLARIGWTWPQPLVWRDDRGVDIRITASTPAAITDLLCEGHRRSLERYAGRRRAEADPAYLPNRRLCADLAERFLRGALPRDVTPIQRGAYRSCANGAVMTNQRAHQGGYIVDDVCPKCGQRGDSLHHRVYMCDATNSELERVMPKWLILEARRAGPTNTFFTSGLFPHPADLWPLPATEQYAIIRNGDGNNDGELIKSMFIDGSCTTSPIRGLARAACCAVEVDINGNMVKEATMNIPAEVTQTPQSAEHGGLYLGVSQLRARTDIYTDCLGVKQLAEAGTDKVLDARRKHGATMLLTRQADPSQWSRCNSLTWVKAHRAEEDAMDVRDAWLIRGNAMADEAAKSALALHAEPSQEAKNTVEFYVKRFPFVAKAIGATLAQFPPAPGNMRRHPPPRTPAEARERGCHQWVSEGDGWRCEVCWTRCVRRRVPNYRRRQQCGGPRHVEGGRQYAARGHRIRAADGDPPFLYCARCGGTSLKRAYKLSRRCQEPNASGRQALARIAKGLHPWRRKDKRSGAELERGRIYAHKAYDAANDQWYDRHDTTAWSRCESAGGQGEGRHRLLNKVGVAIKCKANVAATAGISRGRQTRDAYDGQGHEPTQAERDTTSANVSEEEPDVFGHGGDLDQGAEHSHTIERSNKCTVTVARGGILSTKVLGHLSIRSGRDEVHMDTDDGGVIVLCHVADLAKGTREGKYAISLAHRKGRAVFTSEANADRVKGQCERQRTRCAQCGGDIAAVDVVERQGCAHYVCGGCYAENRDWERKPNGGICETAYLTTVTCRRCREGAGAGRGDGGHDQEPAREGDTQLGWGGLGAEENHQRNHKRSREQDVEAGTPGGGDAGDGPGTGKTAAQRLAELRERVRKRQGVESACEGRAIATEGGPRRGEEGEHGTPAPATPRIDPDTDERRGFPAWRWESRGCGCNGRLHYGCARRRVSAAAGDSDPLGHDTGNAGERKDAQRANQDSTDDATAQARGSEDRGAPVVGTEPAHPERPECDEERDDGGARECAATDGSGEDAAGGSDAADGKAVAALRAEDDAHRLEAAGERAKGGLEARRKRSREVGGAPGERGGGWQLEGGGELPFGAGLPHTQAHSVSGVQQPLRRRCGGASPRKACVQLHRPREPALSGRGLWGTEPAQCPQRGGEDAQGMADGNGDRGAGVGPARGYEVGCIGGGGAQDPCGPSLEGSGKAQARDGVDEGRNGSHAAGAAVRGDRDVTTVGNACSSSSPRLRAERVGGAEDGPPLPAADALGDPLTCLRAGKDCHINVRYHRYPLRGQGELRRQVDTSILGLRGDRAQHNLWGSDSLCSTHLAKAQPEPHHKDMEVREVANLAGLHQPHVSPARTNTALQEHRRHAEAEAPSSASCGPVDARVSGAGVRDGHGAAGRTAGRRRRGADGEVQGRGDHAEGKRSRTEATAEERTTAATVNAQPGSDVAPPWACVKPSGAKGSEAMPTGLETGRAQGEEQQGLHRRQLHRGQGHLRPELPHDRHQRQDQERAPGERGGPHEGARDGNQDAQGREQPLHRHDRGQHGQPGPPWSRAELIRQLGMPTAGAAQIGHQRAHEHHNRHHHAHGDAARGQGGRAERQHGDLRRNRGRGDLRDEGPQGRAERDQGDRDGHRPGGHLLCRGRQAPRGGEPQEDEQPPQRHQNHHLRSHRRCAQSHHHLRDEHGREVVDPAAKRHRVATCSRGTADALGEARRDQREHGPRHNQHHGDHAEDEEEGHDQGELAVARHARGAVRGHHERDEHRGHGRGAERAGGMEGHPQPRQRAGQIRERPFRPGADDQPVTRRQLIERLRQGRHRGTDNPGYHETELTSTLGEDDCEGHARELSGASPGVHSAMRDAEFQAHVGRPAGDPVLTHHHHPDRPALSVHDDKQHHHNARHQTSPCRIRPSHQEAERQADGADHIGRCYYGGCDSSPAIPCTPNLAAHGLEGSR